MIRVAKAITWEYWRQNCWKILIALLVTIFFANLIGEEVPDMKPGAALLVQYLFLLMELISLGILVIIQYSKKKTEIGFPPGLFTEPVPTWFLVLCHMLLGVLSVLLVLGCAIGIIYLHTGSLWPVLGPCLFLALVVTWMQALTWSCAGHPSLHTILGGLLILVFAQGFGECYGISTLLVGLPRHGWTPTLATHPLMLGLGIAGAYILALLGVTRDRCGDRLNLAWIKQSRWPQIRSAKKHRNFQSPVAAQCWFENRRVGRSVLVCNLFVITLILGLGFSGVLRSRTTETCAALFWILAVVNLMFYPTLLGIVLGQQGGPYLTMDPFKAIQPVSNAQLMGVYCRTALGIILKGWVVYFVGMGILLSWLFLHGGREPINLFFATMRILSQAVDQPESPWHSIRFVISLRGLGFVCVWAGFALTASLLFTGRRWVVLGTVTGSWAVVVLWDILCGIGLIPQGIVEAVQSTLPWFFGLGFLSVTTAFFVLARRKSITHRIMPWVGLALWITFCIIGVAGDIVKLNGPASNLILVLGLLTWPVAPLAIAPLALAWNRHR